jgi:hypothetical protein
MDGKLPYYQPTGFNFSGTTRRYYIAAEIDTWDYAPTGTSPLLLPPPSPPHLTCLSRMG